MDKEFFPDMDGYKQDREDFTFLKELTLNQIYLWKKDRDEKIKWVKGE